MTFYQELQLNQSGSKNLIKNSPTRREKWIHTLIYFFKIAITMVFCFFFVAGFSMIFGNDNSVAGVVILLCVMVFRFADFDVSLSESIGLLSLFFTLMIVSPHAAHLFGPIVGLVINLISLLLIMLLGCHNPSVANQSTLVLGYLLLYGYDVSGHSYLLRSLGLLAGGIATIIIFYRNHRKKVYRKHIKDLLAEFSLTSETSRWQLSLVLCVCIVVCLSELLQIPRAMWGGIAAMSTVLPVISNMKPRIRDRIIGNVCGGLCFLMLYFTLPPSIYAYIGVIGGIGVGLSIQYGWQAVFNTFGALAIATEAFGLKEAISLRVFQNIFGALMALLLCHFFNHLFTRLTADKKTPESIGE